MGEELKGENSASFGLYKKGRGVGSTARGVSFLDGVTDTQGEGVRSQQHLSPLPLLCNAIGSQKSIFPGVVMVYSSMFYSHFTLKGFQKIFFYGQGREIWHCLPVVKSYPHF